MSDRDLARLDLKADERGFGREIFLLTKNHELWHIVAEGRNASIHEFGEFQDVKLLACIQATPFVWFVEADKQTLQKHGAIRKHSEDASSIVLQVENQKKGKGAFNYDGYWSSVVHLRKPDLLPVKLIVQDDEHHQSTWEFTAVHENVEFNDSDFIPPKLGPEWKVSRQRLQPANKDSSATRPNGGEKK